MRTYLAEFSIAADVVDDVVLCLQEACKNSVRYSGATCSIGVAVTVTDSEVRLVVRDHGIGFDGRLLDRTAPPDQWEVQGRGLFLMRTLMDDLTVKADGGAIVTMRRRLGR